LRDDELLPGYIVFVSRTRKAAEKNRSSQKPPAVWTFARTFGNRLYAWVKDGKGHAATANQPFEVR
jgi:hypothetical protein